MHCANVGGYLHRHLTKQLYVGSPSELPDRNLGSDKAYLQKTPLIYELPTIHSHLRQTFDLMD